MVPARTNSDSVKRKVPTIRLKDDADLKVRKVVVPNPCAVVEELLGKVAPAVQVLAADPLTCTSRGSNSTFLPTSSFFGEFDCFLCKIQVLSLA